MSGSKQNYMPFVFTRPKSVLQAPCSDTIMKLHFPRDGHIWLCPQFGPQSSGKCINQSTSNKMQNWLYLEEEQRQCLLSELVTVVTCDLVDSNLFNWDNCSHQGTVSISKWCQLNLANWYITVCLLFAPMANSEFLVVLKQRLRQKAEGPKAAKATTGLTWLS